MLEVQQVGLHHGAGAGARGLELVGERFCGFARAVAVQHHARARTVQAARDRPRRCAVPPGDEDRPIVHAIFGRYKNESEKCSPGSAMALSAEPVLPPPAPEAAAHSRLLAELIASTILDAGGWIPFERYMELALAAPGQGY